MSEVKIYLVYYKEDYEKIVVSIRGNLEAAYNDVKEFALNLKENGYDRDYFVDVLTVTKDLNWEVC